MSVKPILFNTEMVKAILEGRKTQTRRLLKPKYRSDEAGFQIITNANTGKFVRVEYYDEYGNETRWMPSPCAPGDILWVRETFCDVALGHPWYYKADGDLRPECWKGERWSPSIHMPKEAARIFLRVKDVRVERLRNMGYSDLADEGFTSWADFVRLWDSTIKPEDRNMYGWNANPWVYMIEFERYEKPEVLL